MDSRSLPLVTVGIPTYDRPQALASVVRAMLAQTYPNIEIIVTDDGDCRETRAALGELLSRIRYVENPRRLGAYGNWNRTIELATGELMAIYHDHDIYDPHIVERCAALFVKHPSVGIVHTAVELRYEDGNEIVRHPFPEVVSGRQFAEKQTRIWPCFVAHGGMMVRKSLYDRLGHFKESFGIAADMDMLVRFSLEGDVGYVPEPLYAYTGRRKGDEFFEFKWANIEDLIVARETNVKRVFPSGVERMRELAHFRVDTDRWLLQHLLWAKRRELREVLEQGLVVVDRFATPIGRAVIRAAISDTSAMGIVRQVAFRSRDVLLGRG